MAWPTEMGLQKHCFNGDTAIQKRYEDNSLYILSFVARVTLWWFSNLLRCYPRSWLVLLILAEISLSREPGVIQAVNNTQLRIAYGDWCLGDFCVECRLEEYLGFPRLMVRPNCCKVSEKLLSMTQFVWLMSHQKLSAKRAAWIRLVSVFVWAVSLHRPNVEPS